MVNKIHKKGFELNKLEEWNEHLLKVNKGLVEGEEIIYQAPELDRLFTQIRTLRVGDFEEIPNPYNVDKLFYYEIKLVENEFKQKEYQISFSINEGNDLTKITHSWGDLWYAREMIIDKLRRHFDYNDPWKNDYDEEDNETNES